MSRLGNQSMIMVDLCLTKKLLFLLLLAVSDAEVELITNIKPQNGYFIINEGELLEFTCTHNREIIVFFPNSWYSSSFYAPRKTSKHELIFEKKDRTLIERTFRRSHSVVGDTGFYGCRDLTSFPFTFNPSSLTVLDERCKFIYIYVKSNNKPFAVETTKFPNIIGKHQGETRIFLPCYLTNPSLKVSIFDDMSNEKIIKDNIEYSESDKVFLVYSNSTSLSCRVELNGKCFSMPYHVTIVGNDLRAQIFVYDVTPYYDQITLFNQNHVKIGNKLRIQCMIKTQIEKNVKVSLLAPRTYEVINEGALEELEIGKNFKATSKEFFIEEFHYNDIGIYSCFFFVNNILYTLNSYINGYDGALKVDLSDSTIRYDPAVGLNEILSQEYQIMEKNSLDLVCSLGRWNEFIDLTGDLEPVWLDGQTMKPIQTSDIIKIQRGLDNTYSEKYCTLKFEHVSLQDAKKYVCSVKDDDNTIYSLFYYDLVIKSKEEPEIIDLNLDNSSTPRIVENPSEVNLNLTCFVSGEPKEKINWLKDGIELNRHDSNDTSLGVEHIIPNTNNQKLFVKSLPVIGKVTYRCQRSYFDSYQILQSKKIESHESNSINSKFFIVLIIMSTFVVITCNLIYLKKREHKIQKRCLQEAGLLQKSDSELNTYLQLNPQEIVQNQVDKLFYDTKWEFNKKRLKLGEKLGNGAFGIVLKAEAYGICSGEETTTVAVKMLHPYADASQVRALASELKVMIYLGKHLNIVNLLGACTDNISKRELYIIVEYCQQGNLHEYLLSNRDSFNDQIYPNSDENSPLKSTFDIHDLISWSYQLARGMEYLSLKKILHGDLAARNVLLTETKIVKICDFGLSRMLYQDESYIKSNRGLLPIRWMSIEAIRDRVFSTQSDVWSYGIVLWEFFSLAEVPYYDVHSDKILTKLLDGYRLKKPEHATENIYEIMLDCWKKNPASRPTFTILVNRMDNMIASYVKTYYTNFTASYETLNVEDPE